MKVLTVAGTRPNIIQEMLINRLFKKRGVIEVLIHSGQHYDYEMSKKFFEEFDLPNPRYHLSVSSGLPSRQTAETMTGIEEIILKEKPTVTLVHGDVNSTLAAALASAKLRVPVAHIEAGLRTPFFYNPEEINRKLTDHISELLFPHIQEAYNALMKENFPPENVFLVGDVVKDTLLWVLKKFNITPTFGDYYLATVHRYENVESIERMTEIVDAFLESDQPIIFPIHPHTKKKLREYGLLRKFEQSKVEVIKPLEYKGFVSLMAGAKKVLTDSGGVRREAYILGKPVVILIEIIWVESMVKCGWSKIVGVNKRKILDGMQNFQPPREHPNIFGDGKAAKRIVNILCERYE